jgi:hypothetical protein
LILVCTTAWGCVEGTVTGAGMEDPDAGGEVDAGTIAASPDAGAPPVGSDAGSIDPPAPDAAPADAGADAGEACILAPTLDLETMHAAYVASYAGDMESQARSGDSYDYYAMSYHLHGMLSAIEATGDTVELARVASLIDTALGTAVDHDGDGYREWEPYDDRGNGIQLGTWQMESAVMRAAALVRTTPAFRELHDDAATRWIAFVHDDVVERWYVDVYDHEIPYVEWSGGSRWWSDKATHFLTIMVFLYQATGDTFYREVAVRGAEAFRRGLHEAGTAWSWSDDAALLGVSGNEAGVPDTSHANREPMWMVFSYEAGIVFTRDDVERMAATLTDVIWNGSLDDPRYTNYIDGSNLPYRGVEAWANGIVYHGWALVGRYSEDAQRALEHTLGAIEAGVRNPSLTRNGSSYGRVALSGHLLRNTAACR